MNSQSDEIKEIAAAMLEVQSLIGPAIKGKVNPFFKSKYATLGDVWDSCRHVLHDNGIVVIQGAGVIDGKACMETKLVHVSGQWFSSMWEMMPAKSDPQAMGSAITYMRRYSLAAMVGILSEDDDGNAASKKPAAGAITGGVSPHDMDSSVDAYVTKTTLKKEVETLVEHVKAARSLDEIEVLKRGYEHKHEGQSSLMERVNKDLPKSWSDRVAEVFAEAGAKAGKLSALDAG